MSSNFDVTISRPETVGGGITTAPANTPLPTAANSKLDPAYKMLGYVSKEGVDLSSEASDSDIEIWGGFKVRKVRSEFKVSLSFTLVSTRNTDTLKAVFGEDKVSVTGSDVTIKHTPTIPPKARFVVNTKDENGFTRRFIVPNGQISTSGNRKLVHNDIDGFQCVVDGFTDDEGVCMYEMFSIDSSETPISAPAEAMVSPAA